MNGKGDRYRPVKREVYDANYDRIFRGDPLCQTWWACELHGISVNDKNPCPLCNLVKNG